MKGLWRAVMLFFLPGMFLGALTYDCFYRVLNLSDDALLWWGIVGAAYLGCAAAAAALAVNRARPGPRYYRVHGFLLALWGAEVCCSVWFRWDNFQILVWQTVLCGAAAGGIAAALLGSSDYSRYDRFWWGLGFAVFAAVLLLAFRRSVGHCIPAGTRCLGGLLTAAFLTGSPLTRRGGWRGRMFYGALLLTALAVQLAVPMQYLPLPDRLDEKEQPPRRWNGTLYTADGWRTLWREPGKISGFYTNYDRLVLEWDEDREYRSAVPGALAACPAVSPSLLCIAGAGSVMPEYFRETDLVSPVCVWKQPETLASVKFPTPDDTSGQWADPMAAFIRSWQPGTGRPEQFDLIVWTALPSGQYAGRLAGFVRELAALLSPDGILVLPEILLNQPGLFRALDEYFPHSGILPGPAGMRVFSRRLPDLSPRALDAALTRKYGMAAPLSEGTYELLFGSYSGPRADKHYEPEKLTLGNYEMGSALPGFFRSRAQYEPAAVNWKLWGVLSVLALFWRFLRLFPERRGNGYGLCNSLENGFACFFLLALAAVWTRALAGRPGSECLAPLLLAGLAVLPFGGGGVKLALGLLLLLPWALESGSPPDHALVRYAILTQSVLCAGALLRMDAASMRERRKLLAMWFSGGCLAVLTMPGILAMHGSLALLWLVALAARLPAIWQKRSQCAILSDNGRS